MGYVRYIVAFFMFFYYIFSFYFNMIPKMVSLIFYNFVPIVYLFFHYHTVKMFWGNIKYKNYIYISFMFWSCAFIWALLSLVYNGSSDFSYFANFYIMIQGIYISLFLAILLYNLDRKNSLLERFFKFYILSCCVYIAITIIMIFIPELKEFWQSVILVSNADFQDKLIIQERFQTRYGLKGFSGFVETLQCTIGVIFALYFVNKKQFKSRLLGSIAIAFLLIGNLCYGRIGIIVSLLAILFTVIRDFSAKKIMKVMIGLFIVIGSTILIISNTLANNLLFDIWLTWLSDPIISFFDGLERGYITFGGSGDILFYDMYFMPKDVETIFIGDGYYTDLDGSYYMHTDAGLMRAMLYYGIIGMFLGYMSLISLIYVAYRNFSLNQHIGIYMCQFIFLTFLIFEVKGDPYRFLFGTVFMLIVAYSYDCFNRKEN